MSDIIYLLMQENLSPKEKKRKKKRKEKKRAHSSIVFYFFMLFIIYYYVFSILKGHVTSIGLLMKLDGYDYVVCCCNFFLNPSSTLCITCQNQSKKKKN
jgi:hypothetical protein